MAKKKSSTTKARQPAKRSTPMQQDESKMMLTAADAEAVQAVHRAAVEELLDPQSRAPMSEVWASASNGRMDSRQVSRPWSFWSLTRN
jgi:hypothetical protein